VYVLHVSAFVSHRRESKAPSNSIWSDWSLNRPAIEAAEINLQPSAVEVFRTIILSTVLVLIHPERVYPCVHLPERRSVKQLLTLLCELSLQERERKQKLRIRTALGMDAEGIDVTEAESAFSLKEKVDDLENAGAESSDEELQFETSDEEEDGLEDSDEEYEELLDASMEKQYEAFLTRRGDDVKTRKAVKRTKVAKRALAGEALVQDSEMFDGDLKQYQKMINPDEVCAACLLCMFACAHGVPHPCYLFRVRSVPPLSCQTWGKATWIAIMSDRVSRLLGAQRRRSPLCIRNPRTA